MPHEIYIHQLNPFALQISENFGIRWYGLAYITGFVLGYYIIRFMIRRGVSPVPESLTGDLVFTVAIGTIVGGRLGYCFFYNPALLVDFKSAFPFWGVLALHEGGMASHGGILGIVAACIIFARRHKLPAWHLMDLMTLGGAVGIFFGRIANFVNGELVGRVVQSPIAWAVKFPQDIFLWTSSEPERIKSLAPVVNLLGVSEASWADLSARMLTNRPAWAAVQQTLTRIISAVQAHQADIIAALRPVLDARHPSQIYEALLEGLFLFLVLIYVWRIPRKPGVITGVFFTVYSVVRIFGEQFRMPDAQIGFQLFGLTRGQWLSFGLLAAGLLILFITIRRESGRLGGWRRPAPSPG